jgi:hypothetical protein
VQENTTNGFELLPELKTFYKFHLKPFFFLDTISLQGFQDFAAVLKRRNNE